MHGGQRASMAIDADEPVHQVRAPRCTFFCQGVVLNAIHLPLVVYVDEDDVISCCMGVPSRAACRRLVRRRLPRQRKLLQARSNNRRLGACGMNQTEKPSV